MKTLVFSPNCELFLADSGHQRSNLALLGRAVRRLREQRSLSVVELGDAIGMARQRIEMLEAGRLDPTYELLLAVAEGLRTQPSALVALAEEQFEEEGEP